MTAIYSAQRASGNAVYWYQEPLAGTTLVIDDATHAHAVDNVTLGVTGSVDLTIADALHGHTAANVVLWFTGDTTLTAADLAAIAAIVQGIVDAGVNVSKMNGATVYGSGISSDKWRGYV